MALKYHHDGILVMLYNQISKKILFSSVYLFLILLFSLLLLFYFLWNIYKNWKLYQIGMSKKG